MAKIVGASVLVLLVIYLVPFLVYASFSVLFGLQAPQGVSPALFLLGVLIAKIGTAAAFVLLYRLARQQLEPRWLAYVGLWWLMYVIGEAGQAIGPNYSVQEAIAGVISESVYFPASGLIVRKMLRH